MRFATEDDFIDVYELFKKNRELLPHIRMGHIARKIEERRCIFTDGVVIIFEIHEKSVQVGKNTKSEKSDCHLNQIVSQFVTEVHPESLISFLISLHCFHIHLVWSISMWKVIMNVQRNSIERNGMMIDW